MTLVPSLPLSLRELSDYYEQASEECEFISGVLRNGLEYIEYRLKPSPLVSVQFNNYKLYYIDFLSHLKWRLSSLCIDDTFDFGNSQWASELRDHGYEHSGVGHPIGEDEIGPMLASLEFVRARLQLVIRDIESIMLHSIFLCHASADKPFVRRLSGDLIRLGSRVWLDEAEILVGDSIIEKIQNGIENSDFLGIVLSRNSVSSIWVRKEVEAALTQEIELNERKVIPILLEPCDIPLFLRTKKYADFSDVENYDDALNQIVKVLAHQ